MSGNGARLQVALNPTNPGITETIGYCSPEANLSVASVVSVLSPRGLLLQDVLIGSGPVDKAQQGLYLRS